jgi:hypothetical protein
MNIDVRDVHGPSRWFEPTGEHGQCSGLAGPVVTDQGDSLATIHLEVQRFQRCHIPKVTTETFSDDEGPLGISHPVRLAGRSADPA